METLFTALHEPTTLAVCCILLGGVARDVVNKLFDLPVTRRTNYRTEIDGLRTEIHALKDEVVRWRDDYYRLLDAVVRGDRGAVTQLLEENGK